jgi:hypothetical protein
MASLQNRIKAVDVDSFTEMTKESTRDIAIYVKYLMGTCLRAPGQEEEDLD